MWIKRNKDGKLVLFSDKPESNDCENLEFEDNISNQIVLSDELAEKYSLNDVTSEDGLVEVSLNRRTHFDCEDYSNAGVYKIEKDYSYFGKDCSYPVKQPDNFYLNKSTYNDNYFKLIKKFVYENYVIINFEYYNKDSGDVNIYRLYIDSVATLEHLWNNDLKKIYCDETETENDETETIDDEISEDCCPMEIYSDETEPINDEISEDSDVCCPNENETDKTNWDVPEAESENPETKSVKSLDGLHNDDVVTVTTVDRAIEIEALKAKFCGFIPEGETPGETDYNIFSYAYKQGIEHFKRYPEATN